MSTMATAEIRTLPDCPFNAEELEQLYAREFFSLEDIAALASKRLQYTVTRAKVREWMLRYDIPCRTFAEAARLRWSK